MRSSCLTFVLLLALAFAGCGGDSSQSVDVEYSSELALSSEQEPESSSQEKILSSSENVSSFVELSSSLAESSSSSVESSSSSAESSSSSLPDYICNYSYGTMTDERDGQVYRTVTFNQLARVNEPEFAWVEDSVETTWMIENLKYAYLEPTETLDSSSICDDDYEGGTLCEKYGRLYLWSAMMDSAAVFSEDAKGCGKGVNCSFSGNVRGVCPEGWHVPSEEEWQAFKMSVYGVEEFSKFNLVYSTSTNYRKTECAADYFSKTVFCENTEDWNVGLSISEEFYENVSEEKTDERVFDFYIASDYWTTIFWEICSTRNECTETFLFETMERAGGLRLISYTEDSFAYLRCVKDRI